MVLAIELMLEHSEHLLYTVNFRERGGGGGGWREVMLPVFRFFNFFKLLFYSGDQEFVRERIE